MKNQFAILRVYSKIPPQNGGMENHIKQLTLEQIKLGHKVIIAFNAGEKISDTDMHILPSFNVHKVPSPLSFFVFYFFLIISLVFKPQKVDIIHLHGDWSSYIFAPVIKFLTKSQKVFFTFHGGMNNGFMHRSVLPLTLKLSDKIFCTGHESYQKIKNKNKVWQPSGVSDHFYNSNTKKDYIKKDIDVISVKMFRKNKNVQTVLEIAKLLPQYTFAIIGDGQDYENIKQQLEIELTKNVTLLGQKSTIEIIHYLSKSKLFLHTSLEEGTPTVVMEAMCMGLPIVSSNAGGTESVVKNFRNGFIVKNDFKNATEYAEKVELLLNNETLYEDMVKNNIRDSQCFKWENVAQNITRQYYT